MVNRIPVYTALLLMVMLLVSNPVSAVAIDDLYMADVSAGQTQQQWQHEALSQVITRLTGLDDFTPYPAIAAELNNAGRYVKQFESQRQNGSSRLKVLLDASQINGLLQQQGIAIWGAHRPEILLWIVQQQQTDRNFLRQQEHPIVSDLLQGMQQHGIPITLPLYDMDDLLQLSETDVWAGFWQPIVSASSRYRPDMIMTAAFDEINRDGESLQRVSWQRQVLLPGTRQTRIVRNELTAADTTELVLAMSAALTKELAAEQAVVLQPERQTYQLEIENLQTLAEVVVTERMLSQVLGVADVTLSEFTPGKARFAVQLHIELTQLTAILQWEPALEALSVVTSGDSRGRQMQPVGLGLDIQPDASYRFARQ